MTETIKPIQEWFDYRLHEWVEVHEPPKMSKIMAISLTPPDRRGLLHSYIMAGITPYEALLKVHGL